MEDRLQLGVPVDAAAQRLPSDPAGDYLQQVHLDGLLDEHHVVLRHGWERENVAVERYSRGHRGRRDGLTAALTEAVVVGGMRPVCWHDGAEDLGSLQGFLAVGFLRWDSDDVVHGSWKTRANTLRGFTVMLLWLAASLLASFMRLDSFILHQ